MSHNYLVGTKDKPLRKTLPAIGVFTITLALAILGCWIHKEPESRWLITLLFIVPWLIQLPSLWFLRSSTTRAFWWFNGGATFLCQVSYLLLWIIYSTSWKDSQWGSRYALGLTFLILVGVGITTFSIMVKPVRDPLPEGMEGAKNRERKLSFAYWEECFQNLSTGIAHHSFWAVTYFIALFLGVAYLFGFAFAFHDQNTLTRTEGKTPALHMVNLNSVDDKDNPQKPGGNNQGKESVNPITSQTGKALNQPTNAATDLPKWSEEEFCFYFADLKANVNQRRDGCPEGISNPSRLDPHPDIQVFNSCSLKAIVERLQRETEDGRRVRVTLVGHTDNEPTKVPTTTTVRYLSNYELSESRAQHAQYEILQQLRANKVVNLKNIEWAIFPAGDEALSQINRGAITEDKFKPEDLTRLGLALKSDRKIFPRLIERYFTTEDIDHHLDPQEKRVVIASLEPIIESPVMLSDAQLRDMTAGDDEALKMLRALQKAQDNYITQSNPKPLKLMDYMYFSIYTITTTGYGDIVPTTAYAKFVSSVANIFEVIFLVVFFNVLLSIKGSPLDATKKMLDASGKKENPPEDQKANQGNISNIDKARSPTRAG